jgi:hypothetical protein
MLMNEDSRQAIQSASQEPVGPVQTLPSPEPPTIPHPELPPPSADSPIASEWNVYRREVARLLAEGQENRWVLIKGEEIIGIWDGEEEARAMAFQKYQMKPCLIQQVRSQEPIVRMSARFWACQK